MNPKPDGPRLIITGGFKLVTRGESSLHGELSLELAVLDPPGDSIWGISSEMNNNRKDSKY